MNPDLGDQYVFIAMDRDSKIIPAYAVGKRTNGTALKFLTRLQGTLNGVRPQISNEAPPQTDEACRRVEVKEPG